MNKSIIVPETLADITLRQWQKYVSIEEPSDEQCVAILCNLESNEVLNLPNDVYDSVVEKLAKLLPQLDGNQTLIKRFNHKGKMYGIIPNLDNITYGANKDILATIGDWDKMHYAMNALYRPIIKTSGDSYEIQEYGGDKTIDELRNMPLDVVFGARFFFLQFNKRIVESYPELFGTSGSQGNSRHGTDANSIYQRKWGSYDETYCLAQGDIRRFDEIAKLPMHQCYMYLSNNVDKVKLERRNAKSNR